MNPQFKKLLCWYWGCAFNRFLMWVLLLLAIGIPLIKGLNFVLRSLGVDEGEPPLNSIHNLLILSVGYFFLCIVVVLPLLLVARFVERRSASEVGLRLQGMPKEMGVGFLFGLGLITLVVIVQTAAGHYQIVSFEGTHGLIGFAAAALLMLEVAILEEVIFRGVIFRIAEDALGTWGAVLVSGLAFGFTHAGNESASSQSSLFIFLEAGILLAAAYALTRQLWLAIGLHCGWNTSLGSLWGLPVSGAEGIPSIFKADAGGSEFLTGGAFGPEAGIIALVICTLAGVILLLVARRRGLVFTPQWMQRLLGTPLDQLKPGRYIDWKRSHEQHPSVEIPSTLPEPAPSA